ncbi:MAG: J domain-containing protein [Phycisphaerales bacterium]|nr:J domain-containing protein [Phycisphaerales bacterium]
MARDYYEVLGVARTATGDEIRRAHRKLAKELHPDKNKSADAPQKFSEVQEAYDTLSDAAKRGQYDQFGQAGAGSNPFAGGRQPRGGAAWQNVGQEDLEEMLGGLGGIGDFFRGGQPSRTRGGRAPAQAGQNAELEVLVDFMTAAVGGTRSVSIRDAQGKSSAIDVRIPAGVSSGGSLRIAGKGHPGTGGAPAGDLIMLIRVAAHPWFYRDGLDVSIDVPITITEAALGTSIDVPLLKGKVTLRVPAGTASGKKLRVTGKGIAPATGMAGDFYAAIQIVAPATLEAVDAAALAALGEKLPNPRETRWT